MKEKVGGFGIFFLYDKGIYIVLKGGGHQFLTTKRTMVILNSISLVAFHSKCAFDINKTQHKYTNIIKY